ncbi:MAG: NUDIX hydrolase [Firmicutes bacterium]|nr:NUDIX hydrolase [Bacillota bacterium]
MAFQFTRKMVKIKGQLREYHIVEHHGAVAIIPWQDEMVTFVYQTRPAVGKKLLEIPAGALEKGEEPLEAARRELAEETGWRAKIWHRLGELYLAPGYSTEVLHLYLATDLSLGEQDLDDSEDIEVIHLPWREALIRAQTGSIKDAKTLAAFLHLEAWLQNQIKTESRAQ